MFSLGQPYCTGASGGLPYGFPVPGGLPWRRSSLVLGCSLRLTLNHWVPPGLPRPYDSLGLPRPRASLLPLGFRWASLPSASMFPSGLTAGFGFVLRPLGLRCLPLHMFYVFCVVPAPSRPVASPSGFHCSIVPCGPAVRASVASASVLQSVGRVPGRVSDPGTRVPQQKGGS